jgi:hypothetical protein
LVHPGYHRAATCRLLAHTTLPFVSYIPVVVLLAVGLVVLALVLLKVAGAARRLVVARGQVNAAVGSSTGFLKARMAALRIAVRDRRRVKTIEKSTEA